jgi:hypothetical protein
LKKSTYSVPHTSSVYGSLQYLIIPTPVSLQAVFERSKQVKLIVHLVTVLRWKQQHCTSKFCDGLGDVHVCLVTLWRNNSSDTFLAEQT